MLKCIAQMYRYIKMLSLLNYLAEMDFKGLHF